MNQDSRRCQAVFPCLDPHSREATDGEARTPASPTQGRHVGMQSSHHSSGAGPPGQVALLRHTLATMISAGPQHGWLPPATHQQTPEVGGRGNPWHRWQSCLAAKQALKAPRDIQHLPCEAARDCSREGQRRAGQLLLNLSLKSLGFSYSQYSFRS